MPHKRFAAAFLLAICAAAAPPPLPELRVEPTAGGSIFYVKNTASLPLTAYVIELVDYPGSSYSFFEEDAATPIPLAGEKRTRVSNMTVGAVPDYVKLQGALYADGSSAGVPEKVTQLLERRRFLLVTTRDMIRRFEKVQAPEELKLDLQNWLKSLPAPTPAKGMSQGMINFLAGAFLIRDTIAALEAKSPDEVLAGLRGSASALAQ